MWRRRRGRPSRIELETSGQLRLNMTFDAAIEAQATAQNALRTARRQKAVSSQQHDQLRLRLFSYFCRELKAVNDRLRRVTAQLTDYESRKAA